MANKHKGEVGFKVDDEEYKLSYSANAIAELEDAFGKGVNEISKSLQDTEKFRVGDLRTIFMIGLQDHQEGADMAKAKALLKRMNVTEVTALVGKAFAAAFPDQEGEGRPPQPDSPKDGTGPAS